MRGLTGRHSINQDLVLLMVILIVDDDNEDCELFYEAINEIDAAIKCWTARDGRQALTFLTKEIVIPPDFIFLDINMPVMNGKDTLMEIKKNTRLRDIPVIMYSTTSDTKEIQGYYRLGAHDFLIKPNNFNKLVEALSSIIVSTRTSK
jgi:CheY-like chemotaxis protein